MEVLSLFFHQFVFKYRRKILNKYKFEGNDIEHVNDIIKYTDENNIKNDIIN